MNFYIVTYINENKNVADILPELENLEYIYELKRLLEIENKTNYNKITIGRWSVEV